MDIQVPEWSVYLPYVAVGLAIVAIAGTVLLVYKLWKL